MVKRMNIYLGDQNEQKDRDLHRWGKRPKRPGETVADINRCGTGTKRLKLE